MKWALARIVRQTRLCKTKYAAGALALSLLVLCVSRRKHLIKISHNGNVKP
jgi:hypothetical protein